MKVCDRKDYIVHALLLFSTATDSRPVVVRRTMITKHGRAFQHDYLKECHEVLIPIQTYMHTCMYIYVGIFISVTKI